MADGKWIRGLTPDMPLDEAARRVLLLRLEVVREFLPLARTQAERDADEPFEDFVTDTVDAVHGAERGQAELIDLARTMMPALLGRLDQAAAGDLGDYARLHQVRIAGKRLRYAMEVFVICFAPA